MRSEKSDPNVAALQFDLFAPPEPEEEPPASAAFVVPDPPFSVVPAPSPVLAAAVTAAAAVAAAAPAPLDDTPIPGDTAEAALSVAEFYDRVKFALRREFPADVWVTGEIRKVTTSKGHRYIELADHHVAGGERGGATLDVACWARDWPAIAAALDSVGVELTAGLVVRIRGRASVWEAGARLRFTLVELDVEALVGGIAAARRRLLHALEAEGILDANRRLPAPVVPMRVGLVTSAGSEAYRDFTGQLQRSGFAFDVRLEACLVQGRDAPVQIAAALRRLHGFSPDVIVVVRGGGAKGDLVAFDAEEVARAIATSRYPVWTGIGHTGDRSVSDEVCQRSLVTPTACGEAVVGAVEAYLDEITGRAVRLAQRARRAIEDSDREVAAGRASLGRAALHDLDRATNALAMARGRAVHGARMVTERSAGLLQRRAGQVASTGRHCLDTSAERLAHRRQVLDAYDPGRQLARGWSLTRTAQGRIVRSIAEVAAGDHLVTTLSDGALRSLVEAAEPATSPPGPTSPATAAPPHAGETETEEIR